MIRISCPKGNSNNLATISNPAWVHVYFSIKKRLKTVRNTINFRKTNWKKNETLKKNRLQYFWLKEKQQKKMCLLCHISRSSLSEATVIFYFPWHECRLLKNIHFLEPLRYCNSTNTNKATRPYPKYSMDKCAS